MKVQVYAGLEPRDNFEQDVVEVAARFGNMATVDDKKITGGQSCKNSHINILYALLKHLHMERVAPFKQTPQAARLVS